MTVHLVTDNTEDAYSAAADSLGSWEHAVAARRIEHVIAEAFQTYLVAARTRPGLTVSGHVMRELVRLHPDVLDAVGGRK